MTESWYDWPSVLAIVLILVVCLTKLHNKQPKFHRIKIKTLMELIFHEQNNFWYFIAKSSIYQNRSEIR